MANEPDDRPWRRDDDRFEDRPRQYDDRDYRERPHYEEPHRGGLILALGIMGFAVCGVCGIFAWFMGSSDIKKMDAGQMDPEGRSLTQAGKIMGLIAMIFMILSVIVLIGVFAFAFIAGAAAPPPQGNNQFQPVPVKAANR